MHYVSIIFYHNRLFEEPFGNETIQISVVITEV